MQRITGSAYPISTGREGASFFYDGVLTMKNLDAGEENGTGAHRVTLSIDSSKVTRTGYNSSGQLVGSNVTHGKQLGVNYIIKAA